MAPFEVPRTDREGGGTSTGLAGVVYETGSVSNTSAAVSYAAISASASPHYMKKITSLLSLVSLLLSIQALLAQAPRPAAAADFVVTRISRNLITTRSLPTRARSNTRRISAIVGWRWKWNSPRRRSSPMS